MDFSISKEFERELSDYKAFLKEHLKPNVSKWMKEKTIPREFFKQMGERGWLGYTPEPDGLKELPSLDKAFLFEELAKLLAVEVARGVGVWAADLFGAVSVVVEHPVHKFPMDAWASSLGEGTQDVQKLIIFRGLMSRLDAASSN